MKYSDYPLPRDPAGPFDVTIIGYEPTLPSDVTCNPVRLRARWFIMPTLRDFAGYIIHPKPPA